MAPAEVPHITSMRGGRPRRRAESGGPYASPPNPPGPRAPPPGGGLANPRPQARRRGRVAPCPSPPAGGRGGGADLQAVRGRGRLDDPQGGAGEEHPRVYLADVDAGGRLDGGGVGVVADEALRLGQPAGLGGEGDGGARVSALAGEEGAD